jgi:hypothetical protein
MNDFDLPMGLMGSFKSIVLDEYLSDRKGSAALAAIVIGNAEGTRTLDGGRTRGFHGYKDPGDGRLRKGSFSFPVSPLESGEEADRERLVELRGAMARYLQAARKAGLDPGNVLLASAYLDSFNQSPSASERFLTRLPDLKTQGITPGSVLQARVSSWVDPRTRKRYVASNGMPVGGGFVHLAKTRALRQQRPYGGEPDVLRLIHEDQARRVLAMVLALKKQGLLSTSASTAPPGSMAASLQRAASVSAGAGSVPKAPPEGSQSVLGGIWDWLWGTLQGDFNKDASVSQISVNAVLGLIPLVDQVLDVRDILAGLKDLIAFYLEDEAARARHERVLGIPYEVWLWLNLFIIAIGCIPEVGSAVKGVLRVLLESLVELSKKAGGLQPRQLQELWARLVQVLGRFGIHEARAAAWLKQLPDELAGWMNQATGKIRTALNAIQNLLSQAEDMALSRYAEWLLDQGRVRQLVDGLRRIRKAVQETYARLDGMKAEVNAWLRELLGRVIGARPADARSVGELSDALRGSRTAATRAEASYQAAVDEFRRALRESLHTTYMGLEPTLLIKMARVGYEAARNGIKKFDVFRREQQLKNVANRIDFDKLTPHQLKELEAAFARGVDDEAAESAGKSFSGKLKGEQVELPGVYTKKIKYTKRDRKTYEELRRKFDSSVRTQFAKSLANDAELVALLRKAGLSETEIAILNKGKIPDGFHVHHKLPLDDGGDNAFSNLVLIRKTPYHKVLTNMANEMTKGLEPGQALTVTYPIAPGVVYPP